MRQVLTAILLSFLSLTAYADSTNSLTLTNAEMQKLKKYFPADDNTHLTWQGDALSIPLPINKEKRIVFPSPVSIDVKSALTSDQLRILNDDKSVYLTALKSFSTTRIYATLKESGEVVLIDLSTDDNASNSTQQIDIKQNNNAPLDKAVVSTISEPVSSVVEDNATTNEASYADLIRFAWQQAYAPDRLIQNSSNFSRAPMHTEKFVSDLIYGDKVIAHPESSWVSGNHYVTAILLRNKYAHPTHIDIRKDICGDWQAATIYPTSFLKSYGDKRGDSAMLFLVSNQPLGETMGVCHGDA